MKAESPGYSLPLIGDRDHDGNICISTVGDECFVAVEHLAIALLHGGGTRSTRVRARAGFGKTPCRKPLPACKLGHIFLVVFFRPGKKNVVGASEL